MSDVESGEGHFDKVINLLQNAPLIDLIEEIQKIDERRLQLHRDAIDGKVPDCNTRKQRDEYQDLGNFHSSAIFLVSHAHGPENYDKAVAKWHKANRAAKCQIADETVGERRREILNTDENQSG